MNDTQSKTAGSEVLNFDSTRREFEDGVRNAWTIGYVCPRMGEGYENVHVNAMWALWKKALTLSHPVTQAGALQAVNVAAPIHVSESGHSLTTAIDALEILDRRPRPMCRDCADENGTCPGSGLPCDMSAVIRNARTALAAPGAAIDARGQAGWSDDQMIRFGNYIRSNSADSHEQRLELFREHEAMRGIPAPALASRSKAPAAARSSIPVEASIASAANAFDTERKAVMVEGRGWYRDDHPKVAKQPSAARPTIEISPEFTDTARSALLWVLWHHQGGSSKVGQPIRFALGMGQHDHLNEHQIAEAKRWEALQPAARPNAAGQQQGWPELFEAANEALELTRLHGGPRLPRLFEAVRAIQCNQSGG